MDCYADNFLFLTNVAMFDDWIENVMSDTEKVKLNFIDFQCNFILHTNRK